MEADFLQELNEPQREAVTYDGGPLMIIAGAGSGKTRVLTYRIARLLANGTDAFRIMSLTFTNKAAREMRDRVEKVVGMEARNLWMGTFHSVFGKILRFDGYKLGYTSNFTIYDTADSLSLIKTIVKELDLDDKLYKPRVVYNRISSAKNSLVSWREYDQMPEFVSEDREANRPEISKIYRIYSERCFKSDAMDFDDLLFNTNVLFRDHLDILNKYQHRFHHIMVDEFQDTNISQYLITKKLSGVNRNICIVGDDAQSIYAFRGADIRNILNFEKDYPDLKTIKLEQNYRSTKMIVQAANGIIAHNKAQLKKQVWTSNEEGRPVRLLKAATDTEEGRLIAHTIFEEKMQNYLKNSDFAVLYRTNYQSRAFEESLRKQNIKYRVVGGLSFYQRKEVKDLVAYFRYAVNQKDEEAFKRIINFPKRGIGQASVSKMVVAAYEQEVPLWNVVRAPEKYAGKGRFVTPVSKFATLMKDCIMSVETTDAYSAASHIAKVSGLLKEFYEDKSVEGRVRYENVQELLNAVKEFTDRPESERAENDSNTLSAFLQEVSLLTSADEGDKDDNDRVTLMTIHASKGLEFNQVFVVGLEEDLFPSQMMLGSRDDLEEERRLFYVAATRAEKHLTLSYALQRYRFGTLKICEPSRFISEVDPACLQTDSSRFSDRPAAKGVSSFGASLRTKKLRPISAKPTTAAPADFAASAAENIKAGMRVAHAKFGNGMVLEVEVNGADRRIRVNFDGIGEKTLLMSFAKLMILN